MGTKQAKNAIRTERQAKASALTTALDLRDTLSKLDRCITVLTDIALGTIPPSDAQRRAVGALGLPDEYVRAVHSDHARAVAVLRYLALAPDAALPKFRQIAQKTLDSFGKPDGNPGSRRAALRRAAPKRVEPLAARGCAAAGGSAGDAAGNGRVVTGARRTRKAHT